jgi:hypothetical protein
VRICRSTSQRSNLTHRDNYVYSRVGDYVAMSTYDNVHMNMILYLCGESLWNDKQTSSLDPGFE